MKRSPLNRRTSLKRGGRLSYRSAKRERDAAANAVTRELVFARDGWRCQMPTTLARHGEDRNAAGPCSGRLTYHHLLKASGGGGYTVENGLSLCAGHNTWVEDHPLHAADLGLVRRGHADQ